MKVLIGAEASGDLDEIYAWIAKDRPRVAASVIDRILSAIDNLGRLPRLGHAGRVPGTYEWVVRGLPYIVVYEIDGAKNALIVTGVFHGARETRRS